MFAQLLFNSIVTGLLLALMAVGFNLVFNTSKVFHLAHGAVYVSGAYAFLFFFRKLELGGNLLGLATSIILAAVASCLIAIVIEWIVYQPIARRNASQSITLIASTGVYLFLVNLIAMLFGNEAQFIQIDLGRPLEVGSVIIVPVQLLQLIVALPLLCGMLFWSRSMFFLKARAVASNPLVASLLGINPRWIKLGMAAIAGALAFSAGLLQILDSGISPHAGMGITLSATAAVIIGGSGSIKGSVLAALLISGIQTAAEWFLSSQWKDGLTFLILVLVILWRTEGIVSFKMRLEEK